MKKTALVLFAVLLAFCCLTSCRQSSDIDGVNVRAFGAVGDNKTDNSSAVGKALAEADGQTVVFPAGEYVFSESVIFTSPVEIMAGAVLCPADDSVTLTFEKDLTAGLYCIFGTDGHVILKKNTVSYPEWFGAEANSDKDNAKAIQCAVDCFPSGYGKIVFQTGNYKTSATITVTQSHITLEGTAHQTRELSPCIECTDLSVPVLYLKGESGGNSYDGGLEDVTVENLEFTRTAMGEEGSDTVLCENTIYTTIRNTGFAHSQNGLRAVNVNGLRLYSVHATTGGSLEGKEVRGVYIDGTKRGSTGILIDDFIYYAYGSSGSVTYGYKDVCTSSGGTRSDTSSGDRRIKNFECSGSTDYGIYIKSCGGFACDISIMEFSMDGIDGAGITLKSDTPYSWQQANIVNAYCRLDNGEGTASGITVRGFANVHCTNVHVDNAVGANNGIVFDNTFGSSVSSCSFGGGDYNNLLLIQNSYTCAFTANTSVVQGAFTLEECNGSTLTGNTMPSVILSSGTSNLTEAANIFAE